MPETYDYVIIGAGSAGCVMAERLSRDPRTSVLVVEAGGADDSMLIHMPRGVIKLIPPGHRHVWSYEVHKGGNGGTATWVKGRGLGGSSSVNGMVYARGFPQDYDSWEATGCPGWGWNEIGRCFKEIEGHELGEAETRGADGPLKVTVQPDVTPLMRSMIAAAGQLGVPEVEDINDAPEGGIGLQTCTIYKGLRMSAARAFLRPASTRPNVTIVTDTLARRIVFDGTRAVKVELRDPSGVREVGIGRELILAAGAIESPKLLQLSGVGPARHLQGLGIPVVADRPQVGQHLLEHVNTTLRYKVKGGSFADEYRGVRLAMNVARHVFARSGPMTYPAHELLAFVKTRPEYDRADGELGILFAGTGRGPDGKMYLQPGHSIQFVAYYGRPSSQGFCLVQSADADRPMLIDANFLATEEDRRHSIDLVRYVDRLMKQPALAAAEPAYVGPGPRVDFASDDEVLDLCHTVGAAGAHVAGTCRMGSDEAAVVDPQLRVRGVHGVRVIDTSVMPSLPIGNTNAPAMATAWRAAELILG